MLEPGLVMDRQLAISSIIQHAESQHGDVEIVARETHGALFRYTYADCAPTQHYRRECFWFTVALYKRRRAL